MPRRPAGRSAFDAITDVAGLRVGHWTDRRAATGCTVVLCPPNTVGGVDVRGAAPGTRETDLLRPENLVQEVHAVVLAGGSAYGLEAASGVMRHLAAKGVGFRLGDAVVPIVPSAILFDLGVGRAAWPDADAGARAARTARTGAVAQGSVGAGTGATVAKMGGRERVLKGGIGTASERLDTGVVVGALVAVNAVGAIRNASGRGWLAAPRGDTPGTSLDPAALLRAGRRETPPTGSNTTIAVVATSARLTKAQANRLATVAHDGLARAIWPVHTRSDGDTVFALATGAHDVGDDEITPIEAFAVVAMERAVRHAIEAASGLADVPSAAEWRASGPRRRVTPGRRAAR